MTEINRLLKYNVWQLYSCSTEQREDFRKWEKYDDSEESFCESDGLCACLFTLIVAIPMKALKCKPLPQWKQLYTRYTAQNHCWLADDVCVSLYAGYLIKGAMSLHSGSCVTAKLPNKVISVYSPFTISTKPLLVWQMMSVSHSMQAT